MKKIFYSLFLHTLVIALIFSLGSEVETVYAYEQESIKKVADVIDFDIDLDSKINLYDKTDNIIAHFYKSKTVGYLIVNALTDKPIEYSNETNRDFFNDSEKKYYYDGPFSYYVEESKSTIKGRKDEIISKSELNFSIENNDFNINTFRKIETRAITKISHTPRNYSYNTGYICASTASAILLMYYNDYVNTKYVPTAYESTASGDTGKKTIEYLVPYINPYTGRGAYIEEIKTGLNMYLKEQGLSQSAVILTKNNVQSPIASNRPAIIAVNSHPTYKDHGMVIYGYNRYSEGTSTTYMLLVVDGWGSTGVYIDREYCTGGVRI